MLKKLTQIEIKSFKLLKKINNLWYIFKNVPFILFFYYDFLNTTDKILLRKILIKNNLTTLTFKNIDFKKFFLKVNFNKLYNLLSGNTLFIYHKEHIILPTSTIKSLLAHPKLILIGSFWNSIFYRGNLIFKLIKLNPLEINSSLYKELMQTIYILRNILTRI